MKILLIGSATMLKGQWASHSSFVDAKAALEKFGHKCKMPENVIEGVDIDPEDDTEELLKLFKVAISDCDTVALIGYWRTDPFAVKCFDYANNIGRPVKTAKMWYNLFQNQTREVVS